MPAVCAGLKAWDISELTILPNKMGLSDNIAVVALVVSLVALLIALAQLSQQLLGTADGYRRCASSIIGIWAQRRHRKFLWSEFRFETQFVTPQIVLVTPAAFFKELEDNSEVWRLNAPELLDTRCKELNTTVHALKQSESRHSWSTTSEKLRAPTDNRTDVEKARYYHSKHQTAGQKNAADQALLVTWIRLLQELHSLYFSYWPQDCVTCTSAGRKYNAGPRPNDFGCHPDDTGTTSDFNGKMASVDVLDPIGTHAAVIYPHWTWDFMPASIMKPLAKTSLGDLVILAYRLGMLWRRIDLENGHLQADGNGYVLSGESQKGLGLVVEFKARAPQNCGPFQRIVPSEAVDKLLCGIIPGCPQLVGRDFDFVGSNRRTYNIFEDGSILEQIGMSNNRRALVGQRNYREPHNELLELICPFLPLRRSTIARFASSAWRPARQSVFFFWEGRISLLQGLEERLAGGDEPKPLAIFRQHMETLKMYREDFYSYHGTQSRIANHRHNGKSALIDSCRSIHNSTTEFFEREGWSVSGNAVDSPNEGSFVSPYCHLLAAHVSMAQEAIHDALARIKDSGDNRQSQEYLRAKFKVGTPEESGNSFVLNLYESARSYVEYVDHSEHGIGKYLQSKGIDKSKEQIECAWWNLMLRGLAFNMSSWQAGVPGEPIPSSWYGEKTPIWIT